VEDIIASPPEWDPYTTLRTKLVTRLSHSKEHCICELLTLKMGDRKPSHFLRHLRSLAPDIPDLLRGIWSSQLPSDIRAVLWSTRGRLWNCSPLWGPHYQGCTPADTRKRSTPPPPSRCQRSSVPSENSSRRATPRSLQLQGLQLQELPLVQQIPLTRR
jgi:hypothetical protein